MNPELGSSGNLSNVEEQQDLREVTRSETQTEKPPFELATERIGAIENLVRETVQKGIERINRATQIGLRPEQIASVRRQLNMVPRILAIHERLRTLLSQSKDELSALGSPGNSAPLETQSAQSDSLPVKPHSSSENPYFEPKEDFDYNEDEFKDLRHEEVFTKRELPNGGWSSGYERKQLNRTEAREKIAAAKEKIAYQKEGLARMRQEITAAIRENPDITADTLDSYVGKYDETYRLTREQYSIASEAIQSYLKKHKKIREVRTQYPNDRALFQAVFGEPPVGKIEVIEGPMTLHFRCHTPEDFVRIISEDIAELPTEAKEHYAETVRGVSIESARIKGLEGTILAENARGRALDAASLSTIKHEEQHAIDRLFGLFDKKADRNTSLAQVKVEKDSEKRQQLLYRLMREGRHANEQRAKSEIFAFFKQGTRSTGTVTDLLTKTAADGGHYDYYAEQRENYLSRLVDGLGEESRAQIERAADTVFGPEYRQAVVKGITAYQDLRQKVGYDDEAAIAILTHEPLTRWPLVARRIMEAKGVKEASSETTVETNQDQEWSVTVSGKVGRVVEQIALQEMNDADPQKRPTDIYLRTTSGNIYDITLHPDGNVYVIDSEKVGRTQKGYFEGRISPNLLTNGVLEVGKSFKYGPFKTTDIITEIVAVNKTRSANPTSGASEASTIQQEFEQKMLGR